MSFRLWIVCSCKQWKIIQNFSFLDRRHFFGLRMAVTNRLFKFTHFSRVGKSIIFCINGILNNTFTPTFRNGLLESAWGTDLTCGPGSVVGIATGYRLDRPGIEPLWGRNFPHLSRPALGPPAFCTMGTGPFPGVKRGRSLTLTPHPFLQPWSRKSRAIHLLPLLQAVRPEQSLSSCTRVHFTFTYLTC